MNNKDKKNKEETKSLLEEDHSGDAMSAAVAQPTQPTAERASEPTVQPATQPATQPAAESTQPAEPATQPAQPTQPAMEATQPSETAVAVPTEQPRKVNLPAMVYR